MSAAMTLATAGVLISTDAAALSIKLADNKALTKLQNQVLCSPVRIQLVHLPPHRPPHPSVATPLSPAVNISMILNYKIKRK